MADINIAAAKKNSEKKGKNTLFQLDKFTFFYPITIYYVVLYKHILSLFFCSEFFYVVLL